MSDFDREAMEVDVVIVGAGPAGLSAAIRLKQANEDLHVVVLEKGSEVGAHILSGAVIDPIGLNKLLPDWRNMDSPVKTEVTEDHFLVLGEEGSVRLPNFMMPPLMNNHGNYIVSMGNVCRWLAEVAEGMGVEIYPGMSCSELVEGENGEIVGVVAGEFGKNADGTPGDGYEPGMIMQGKYVLISEGARGSLSKQLIAKYDLDKDSQPQKYGLGMKEIWDVDPEVHQEGKVVHTMGWPLGWKAGGGSFMYHAENNQVFVGYIVDLNYKNPHLFPYMEFQRWKHHPEIAKVLSTGKRVAYGARAVTKGGFQSMPKATFPGGALLGCSVGLVNLPRIKGNHNAMLSGIAAADAVAAAIAEGRQGDELTGYDDELRSGEVGKDLKRVRNVAPLNGRYGPVGGLTVGGLDMWLASAFGGRSILGTVSHGKTDAESTEPAEKHKPIDYPKPDGKLSFDRLTNVAYSFTNHEESQPSHLKLKDAEIPVEYNLPVYDGPSARYCPAGVYEFVRDDDGSNPRFQINFQNCVHCKTCDIKDPRQNIVWTTPQGGDGPNYPNM